MTGTRLQLRENQERVEAALRERGVDEIIACRATAFDKLAGAMYAFGYWEQLEETHIALEKDGDDVPNPLVLHELATLPLLRIPNPYQAPTYLFQDVGVLRFLGFTLAQIRDGFNSKGVQNPTGKARMRCHQASGTGCCHSEGSVWLPLFVTIISVPVSPGERG